MTEKKKKIGWVLLAAVLACLLLGLVLLSCNYNTTRAPEPADDWSTDNEDPCCPGDWDATMIATSGWVTRSSLYAYGGSYSYEHAANGGGGSLWAQTRKDCVVPVTEGVYDAEVLFTEDPGHSGSDWYPFLNVGNVFGFSYRSGWYIYFHYFTRRAVFICVACNPDVSVWLNTVQPGVWHNYRVEWNLPVNPGTGSFDVWMDDALMGSYTGITMDHPPGHPYFGNYYSFINAGAGPWNWSSVWGDANGPFPIYVDDVQFYPCDEPWPDPTPTPAPTPVGGADQYGHAAVLNVDDDCSAVLRFRAIPNEVPHDAVVTRATLFLYGISVEQAVATINVAPLVPVWGEMTCDWCRRTVGEDWADPGATNVPLDRNPGKIAEFTAALGWVEVDIPPYIVEEWALTSAANPGLILSNEDLTGKYGIASREWIDADYRPYMVVYYTE